MQNMTINQARKLTGSYLKNLSDEQVQDLLNQVYGLAEIVADLGILRGSNKSNGVIDSSNKGKQNECK